MGEYAAKKGAGDSLSRSSRALHVLLRCTRLILHFDCFPVDLQSRLARNLAFNLLLLPFAKEYEKQFERTGTRRGISRACGRVGWACGRVGWAGRRIGWAGRRIGRACG